MKEKICFKCNKLKSVDDFYKHPQMSDGHVNKCKECNKKDTRENYKLNIDKYKEYDKNRANLPHRKKAREEYQKNNSEKMGIYKRKYSKNNPEKRRFLLAKRRSAKLQRTPKWSNLEKIKEIYLNCPKDYSVDHIIPLQGELVSGLHVPQNLQYLTKSENSIKRNKFVPLIGD